MVGNRAGREIAADNRAVSAVIGFILVFGILMLLLTIYQAQIVPQQNAQTEFEHFEETRDELVELRNSISTAGQNDKSQFPSVTLGTTYQSRLLTINPTPPTGTVRTSDAYNITISNGTAEHDLNISTRFLEYEPSYNEISVGPTRYEHSVLYLDERDRGNNVSIIEEQNLVKDGTVRLTALQNEFQQTGRDRVTLELYPQDDVNESEFPEQDGKNLTVTIPTQLDEDEYWDESLADAGDIYQGTEDRGEIHALNLSVDEDDLEVNTVGIQLEPDEDPAKNTDPQAGNGNAGNGEDEPKLNAEAESPVEEDDQSGITVSAEFGSGDPVSDEDIEIDVNDPGGDAFIRAVGEDPGDSKIVNVGTNVNDDPLVVTTDENGNFGTAEDDGGEEFDVDVVEYDVAASSEEAGDEVDLELKADQIGADDEVTIEVVEEGGGEAPTFNSFDADRTGNNDIEYNFEVSAGDSDLTEVEVRAEDSGSGDELDTELYDNDNNEAAFDPSGFSVSEGDLGGLGNPDEADVVFETTDENGNTVTERVEGLTN